MKLQLQKRISILLSAAMLAVGASPVWASAEENMTIRVMIWGQETEWVDSADNPLTQWVREQAYQELGIDVEFVKILQSDDSMEEKLIKGKAPDIIYIEQEDFCRFVEQGLLADLTEAYENYGENIRALGSIEQMGNIDGIQYAVISRGERGAETISYIREDWLEALGMDIPETKEEFIQYLYAVKEQNPGNVENVIPWAMSGRKDSGSEYLEFVGSYVMLENERDAYIYSGEYMAAAPGALEGIRQMNILYNDGLISPYFIDDTNAAGNRMELQIKRGNAGFFSSGTTTVWYLIVELTKELKPEGNIFLPVQCFELPDGGYRALRSPEYGEGATGVVCVPAASQEKAEACVRYLNWMADPAVSEDIMYGPEHVKDEYGFPLELSPSECDELGYPWPTSQQRISLMNRHLAYQDDPEAMISWWKTYTVTGSVVDDAWLRRYWDLMQENAFRFPAFAQIPQAEIECGEAVKADIIQYVYQLINCAPEEFDSLQETLYRQLEEEGLSKILEERAAYYDSLGRE